MTKDTFIKASEIEKRIHDNNVSLGQVDVFRNYLPQANSCALSISTLDENGNLTNYKNIVLPTDYVRDLLAKYEHDLVCENTSLSAEFATL